MAAVVVKVVWKAMADEERCVSGSGTSDDYELDLEAIAEEVR